MLTRRHLRIKVLQTLYAFYQAEESNVIKGEKELFQSIEKVYDLYLLLMILPLEIRHQANLKMEENKNKLLPSPEDLNPNLKFVNNPVLDMLANSAALKAACDKRKISWLNHIELVKKLFNDMRQSEWYEAYMNNPNTGFEEHKNFIAELYGQLMVKDEAILSFFEEDNVYWQVDTDLAASSAIKTIKGLAEGKEFHLMPLWKNKQEDEAFAKDLFVKAVMNKERTDKWIKAKADNWELERIASMDIILMNMAITEAIIFPSIPVKVSLNEYIDLAKDYSTPKSGTFVNGILDKVFYMLKNDGTIKKTGRGLIE
jgi:N utilization substance protein B